MIYFERFFDIDTQPYVWVSVEDDGVVFTVEQEEPGLSQSYKIPVEDVYGYDDDFPELFAERLNEYAEDTVPMSLDTRYISMFLHEAMHKGGKSGGIVEYFVETRNYEDYQYFIEMLDTLHRDFNDYGVDYWSF